MKELDTGTKPNRYALATRASLEKIAEDFREENKKLKEAVKAAQYFMAVVDYDRFDDEHVKLRKKIMEAVG